jgi:hypothetical protein
MKKYDDNYIEHVADLYLQIKEHNKLIKKYSVAIHKKINVHSTFERFLQFMAEARV